MKGLAAETLLAASLTLLLSASTPSSSSSIVDRVKRQAAEDFQCPEPSGMFADPATCRRFYTCVDKHPYRSNCPSGLFFDDITKSCNFKTEVTCGPVARTEAPSTTVSPDAARKCEPNQCQLPYCFCSSDGTRIPKDMEPKDVPQMILLTFDDAVNLNNYEKYKRVFNGTRVNPNGCPIMGTFFLTHEYTNYQMVQDFYSEGHEVALHTISHKKGLHDGDYDVWTDEMIGMRELLRRYANVSIEDILGMRAPFLMPGRNAQYEVLRDFKLAYDSSIGVPPLEKPVWPYTLDYEIAHECKAGTCPDKSFPGIWEIPLNAHYVSDYDGGHCPYMDQCVLFSHDPEDIFRWLKEDFERYYNQNRAPYVMAFHTNWFQQMKLEKGLHLFIDWALQQDDIYFVTATQALLWITDPVPLSEIRKDFEAWDCQAQPKRAKACNRPNSCGPMPFVRPGEVSDSRYMTTCFNCPPVYPWVGDTKGLGSSAEKEIYRPEIIS